jgi:hypothetical protein
MNSHPNAVAGLAGGAGLGTLLVWILNKYAGADLPPEAATAIAGAVGALVLLIGKRGLKGLIGLVWHGDQTG